MRIPLAGNISTKDGAANKNSRLYNVLAETRKDGKVVAGVRPGLDTKTAISGNGNGLVCFNGKLISVNGADVYEIETTIIPEGIQDLGAGTLGGAHTVAYAASSDGTVIVGETTNASSQYRAFRWTSGGGMVDLGTLGGSHSGADFCSSDGSVVVGWAYNASSQTRAFRWTSGGGMVDLGTLGGSYSRAYCCSSDGSVVVGFAATSLGIEKPFKWTAAGGMVDLANVGDYGAGYARGCSSDGSVIVGQVQFEVTAPVRAFKWTAAGGMVDLTPSIENETSVAYKCTPSGGVIVGQIYNNVACYWDSLGNVYELGTLGGGGVKSYAFFASSDGSVIVGESEYSLVDVRHAFRWDAVNGMVDLGTLGGSYSGAQWVSGTGDKIIGTSGNLSEHNRIFEWNTEHEETTSTYIGTLVADKTYDFALIP